MKKLVCLVIGLQFLLNLKAQQDTLCSLELNGTLHFIRSGFPQTIPALNISITPEHDSINYSLWKFENRSTDTIVLRNVVPTGIADQKVYITGKGDHTLSRSHLFVPGKLPINVVCPDNAWELGFACIEGTSGQQVYLTRRVRESIQNGVRKRFETILYPGGSVMYKCWKTSYAGTWQEGLRVVFQQNKLYDLPSFDHSMFERKDLQWIRNSYVMHLIQAWDHQYLDPLTGTYNWKKFQQRGKQLYGGDDVIGVWPTWPSLGLDQRNQFDLFRDLPGGTKYLHTVANELRKDHTKFFICYNPWDESTRSEGHLAGLEDLIKATSADGVVLDTKGESSKELQNAADKVRPGVVMYSEGMAVPKDMPYIVSGRVHNALYYVPMLNLNKFIAPDFAIFRVAELFKEPIRREFNTSFFNGYGTELNIFAPGMPDEVEDQYRYLGRTSRILREHTNNFTSNEFTPLIPTQTDSIWVNEWPGKDKTIYTIYSLIPQGFKGLLFPVKPTNGTHFVDLWHHRLLEPVSSNKQFLIEAETDAFHQKWLGTNNESSVDCIAQLPILLQANRKGNRLHIEATRGTEIRIWAGNPSYEKIPKKFKPGTYDLSIFEHFGRFEGNFIIQLMDGNSLLDETILTLTPGTARRISTIEHSNQTTPIPAADEVKISGGKFTFHESHGDEFIPYPMEDKDQQFNMPSFYMDRFPVTNAQFKKFLESSHYKPKDTVRFLMHWKKGKIPIGQEKFPVTYVSYEDAKAYAKWAGKRLPSELEWQYAAQTSDLREWPWTQTKPVTRKEEVITETLTTYKIEGIDSLYCPLNKTNLFPVGSYEKGANPFGLQDLVGCVWQLTNDEYINGSYTYVMLKGGSYFNPSSSWWYVQSGPRELHYRQYLLRVSPGFERNATVGFRCMRDE